MKKKIALLLTLAFLLSLALCACGAGGADNGTSSSGGSSMSMNDASAPQVSMESVKEAYGMSDSSFISVDSAIYSDPDAKVIRTAEMTIQTIDFDQSATALAALTEEQGGYYETAQVDGGSYYDQGGRRWAYYVVRVPRENFVAFRDSVSEVGHLYSITEDSKNVGEEYYDTEARLATLETKQERLLALLDKAELMEDIISLETALADVQYEIDMYNTTLRKYDSLINYSTFTIHLEEVTRIVEEPKVQDSFGTKLLASLKDGLTSFGDGLQSFALWLARNIITLVILAVIIFMAVRVALHVRKKRRYDPEN